MLALVFVVFYSLLHIFTWAMTRYRLPVDAVLLPFAALGLLTAGQWIATQFGGAHKHDAGIAPAPGPEVQG
jgi:hypothetical protein